MIVTALIAATVAAAEPTAPVMPVSATPPATEQKDCCEKMKAGEGCDCCKDMDGKAKEAHAEHSTH